MMSSYAVVPGLLQERSVYVACHLSILRHEAWAVNPQFSLKVPGVSVTYLIQPPTDFFLILRAIQNK
jgi:hypothetical protein